MRSDSGRYYETTKERYVFNLPQIQTLPDTQHWMCERNVTIYFSKHNGILSKWLTFGFDFTWPCCCINGIFPYCRVLSLVGSSRNHIWSLHWFKRQRLSLWWVALRCFLQYQNKNTFDSIDKYLRIKEFLLFKIVTSVIPIHQQAKGKR